MSRRTLPACARGFTLIELLIVIAILGTLAAVLVPNIMGATDASKNTTTEATFLRLQNGCEAWSRKHGYYPPDDLKSPEASMKLQWRPDNNQNTGIESLVAFLSLSRADGEDLSDLGDTLTNTDHDEHGAEQPLLKRKDRPEVADAFGMPLAYFHRLNLQKSQTVVGPDGEPMPAKAKRREDGSYHGADKYQLLSAGKDGIFGTDDDLVWPRN